MGAPKQKWTAEEEAALKAGVHKYGPGKWRTILTDPEFGAVLHMRSNVDLKDKWRNINVTTIWGSRQKARLASVRKNQLTLKHDNETLSHTAAVKPDDAVDAKPLAVDNGASNSCGSKERVKRLDSLIMEAITTMKEPSGSDRAAIAAYIEEQYWAPPNLRKLLSAKLKHLIANGKLIKVKHRYIIGPNSRFSEGRKLSRTLLDLRQKDSSPRAEKRELKNPTLSQIDDDEATGMRSVAEAAAAAAKAVAEAEAAIAEAEEAAREADAAEAEAEAAQVFALAAMNAFNFKSSALERW